MTTSGDQVMIAHRQLGNATHHEDVGRDVLAPVATLVEDQKVAPDVNIGLAGEIFVEGRDQVLHLVAMQLGFAHGPPVPRGIVDIQIRIAHRPRRTRHDDLPFSALLTSS
jgi:hypothetical protein